MSRKYALDLLKIVACMAVIGQHNVSLDPSLPLKLWGENFFIYYLCRFAVPIFVMISGILLLDPKHPLSHKKIWKVYIPRLLIGLLVIQYIDELQNGIVTGVFPLRFLYAPVVNILRASTAVPYWYIYMLIGLYIMAPFLQKMLGNLTRNELFYLMILFFFDRSLVPFLSNLSAFSWMGSFVSSMMLSLFSGYIGYFLLGYVLYNYVPNTKRIATWSAGIGLFSLVGPWIVLLVGPTEKFVSRSSLFSDVFAPNIFLFCCCLLLTFRYWEEKIPQTWKSPLKLLSDAGLGIYLWHVVIIHFFGLFVSSPYAKPFILVPLLTVGNYILSFLCSKAQSLSWKWIKGHLPILQQPAK